jgi:hypothetical protein
MLRVALTVRPTVPTVRPAVSPAKDWEMTERQVTKLSSKEDEVIVSTVVELSILFMILKWLSLCDRLLVFMYVQNRRQLLELGVSEADATRALSAVSGRGLQAALEYLFSSAVIKPVCLVYDSCRLNLGFQDTGTRRNKSKPKDQPVKELKSAPAKISKTPERNDKKSKEPEAVQKAIKSKESLPSKGKSPKPS